MKGVLGAILLMIFIGHSYGQNLNLLGHLDYDSLHSTKTNDIWGYVDENGNEYALVGCRKGTSIVDVTDPANPTEVFWEPGMNSIWRDLKVYNDFAYVTTEAENGLLIIDLNPLPASTNLPVYFYSGPTGNTWSSAHNLFIDENGFCYVFGANRGNGGVIILDLNQDPTAPVEVGEYDNQYCHDGYVRNDTAYFAQIYAGYFSVVDVSDKANPVLMGQQTTPTQFAHQIWVDSAGIVYVLDEVTGGYIASYDVSNMNDIQLLDKIQCSPGNDITPHNGFVIGDFLVSAYYSYGVSIHDISNPDNMVEVGSYDTNPHDLMSTDGCWGVYPYLPSGNIIATDVDEGLFILQPNYQYASFLTGTVTDFDSGLPLSGVDVDILGVSQLDLTEVDGTYKCGSVNSGTFDVVYSKLGHYPDTAQVVLNQGQTAVQDMTLVEIPRFPCYIKVTEQGTGNNMYNAKILLDSDLIVHETTSDGLGEASIEMIYPGTYTVQVAKWGYEIYCQELLIDTTNDTFYVELNTGYEDDFSQDLGWTSYGNASEGHWERGTPLENTQDDIVIYVPGYGAPDGCNDKAYVTENAANFRDVDEGTVVLVSPVFDLTSYTDPHINYYTWFFNNWGQYAPDDSLKVFLSNGSQVKLIDWNTDEFNSGEWELSSIRVGDFFTPSNVMQLIIEVRDTGFHQNYTEGGFDNFSVTDYYLGVEEVQKEEPKFNFFPNPSTDFIRFKFDGYEKYWLTFYDLSGKMVKNDLLYDQNQLVDVQDFDPGIYLINLRNSQGTIVYSGKLLKL